MKSSMRLSLSQQVVTHLVRNSWKLFSICLIFVLGINQIQFTYAQETAVSLKIL